MCTATQGWLDWLVTDRHQQQQRRHTAGCTLWWCLDFLHCAPFQLHTENLLCVIIPSFFFSFQLRYHLALFSTENFLFNLICHFDCHIFSWPTSPIQNRCKRFYPFQYIRQSFAVARQYVSKCTEIGNEYLYQDAEVKETHVKANGKKKRGEEEKKKVLKAKWLNWLLRRAHDGCGIWIFAWMHLLRMILPICQAENCPSSLFICNQIELSYQCVVRAKIKWNINFKRFLSSHVFSYFNLGFVCFWLTSGSGRSSLPISIVAPCSQSLANTGRSLDVQSSQEPNTSHRQRVEQSRKQRWSPSRAKSRVPLGDRHGRRQCSPRRRPRIAWMVRVISYRFLFARSLCRLGYLVKTNAFTLPQLWRSVIIILWLPELLSQPPPC